MRLIFLAFFLFFSTSSWAMGHLSEQSSESPLIGRLAPDAVLKNTLGFSASIIDWRQGGKAILVFWATWCPHCYEELGTLNKNYASIEKKGIKVILVDVGENTEDVRNYFKQRQMKLMSFVDEDSVLKDRYRLIGVPTVIFIDEKGIVRNVSYAFPSDYANYFSSK